MQALFLFVFSFAVYLASLPYLPTIKERVLVNAICVGGIFGIIGTMVLLQPGWAVPLNFASGVISSVVVSFVCILFTALLRRLRAAL